jgi:S-adenosylmethionine:tRNA ribosyltransferase-isomerase
MTELEEYDYQLPGELIAQFPLAHRADARLLIVDRGAAELDHAHVRDLPELLRPDDCLVLNDTRVVKARLLGRRISTGGRWQGLFLDEDADGNWRLLCKTRGKLFPGERIALRDLAGDDVVVLRLLTRLDQGVWAGRPETDEASMTLLDRIGRVPLPHYIRRGESLPADQQDYQTVFAEHLGSVAAPTAGRHFTAQLLAKLQSGGVQVEKVTLHVGVGTFRPIASAQLSDHQMHREWCRLDPDTAARLRAVKEQGRRIIAVGTTTVRTLETAARDGSLQAWEGDTELFIQPGYEFRAIDGLITNFHLPRSTLLVLVCAFAGRRLVQQAYQTAIEQKYRFFSYGDAMLIV